MVKSIDVDIFGSTYNIPINKTIKDLKCFHYFYIGDAKSYYRYPLYISTIPSNPVFPITKYSYTDYSIVIDFENDSDVPIDTFELVCPKSTSNYEVSLLYQKFASVSGYATCELTQSEKKLTLFWPDERLISIYMDLYVKYKDTIVNLQDGTSSGVFSAFNTLANIYPELKNPKITYIENPLEQINTNISTLEHTSTSYYNNDGGDFYSMDVYKYGNFGSCAFKTSRYNKACGNVSQNSASIQGGFKTVLTGLFIQVFFDPVFYIKMSPSYYEEKFMYSYTESLQRVVCNYSQSSCF